MNKRQRKKQFKKRFGFNPPKNIPISTATQIMENKETIIEVFEKIKKEALDICEKMKRPLLELAKNTKEAIENYQKSIENKSEQHEVLEDYQTKMMLQQRQQEKEVMRIESNSNIHINSRREKSRGNQVI